jgi:hypothetical protein
VRRAALILVGLSLAGCETASEINPFADGPPAASAPSATPDGLWTGRASRIIGNVWGENVCPEVVPMVMTVENGQVRGEVRSPRDRTVTSARFQTFVDANGRLAARVYFLERANELTGQFTGAAFRGTLQGGPSTCSHAVSLTRERA